MKRRTICFVLLTALVLPGAPLHAEETSAPLIAPASAPAAEPAAEPVPAPVTAPAPAPAPVPVTAPAPDSAPPPAVPAVAPESEPVADTAASAPAPGPASAEQVGKWTFSMNESGPDLKKIGAAGQKKLKGSLQEIARLITTTPVMSPPKGFEVRFWGSFSGKDRYDICTGKHCPPSRPTAVLAMMIGRYADKGGRLKAAFNTPSTMDVSTNSLGQVFSHLPVLHKDADGYILPEPAAAGERAGMPTYLNNGHAVAVLARKSRPLWLPVSRERYLKAEIAAVSKELGLPPAPVKKGKNKPGKGVEVNTQSGMPILVEEGRTWIDPADEKAWVEKSRSLTGRIKESAEVLKERLLQLQAELAGLTPEQRTVQARVDGASADGQSPSLLPLDSSSGVAVVTPNFRYFNPKLPLEALQLVVIQWKFDGNTLHDPEKSGISETLNNRALLEIYKTMDWNKLRNKVTQTAP